MEFSEQCLMLFSGMHFGAFMANRFQDFLGKKFPGLFMQPTS